MDSPGQSVTYWSELWGVRQLNKLTMHVGMALAREKKNPASLNELCKEGREWVFAWNRKLGVGLVGRYDGHGKGTCWLA